MTRIIFIIKELFRNLVRNPGTAFSSMLSLLLLFLLFDLFWVGSLTADRFYSSFLADLQVEMFIPEEQSEITLPAIQDSLVLYPEIKSVQYVSREIARQKLEQLVGIDLLVGYDSLNPLPRSFILEIDSNMVNSGQLQSLEMKLVNLCNGAQVQYSKEWLFKVEDAKSLIFQIGIVLGILILSATLISSANNIRLMARARASGLQQMRLLGASRSLVAMPFIWEGFLLGGISGALSWLLILYAQQKITFTQFTIIYPLQDEMLYFSLATALLGALSGYVGIRKFLK